MGWDGMGWEEEGFSPSLARGRRRRSFEGMIRRLIPFLLCAGMASAQTKSIEKPAAEPPRVPGKLDALTLEPEVRTRIDDFFALLKQRKVEVAYGKLFDGSILPDENPEMVKKLMESTTRVLEMTGRIDGAEFLRARAAGRTLREVTYVLNGEKRPLRWTFYFYFTGGHWQILDTNVATEASGFFVEGK